MVEGAVRVELYMSLLESYVYKTSFVQDLIYYLFLKLHSVTPPSCCQLIVLWYCANPSSVLLFDAILLDSKELDSYHQFKLYPVYPSLSLRSTSPPPSHLGRTDKYRINQPTIVIIRPRRTQDKVDTEIFRPTNQSCSKVCL